MLNLETVVRIKLIVAFIYIFFLIKKLEKIYMKGYRINEIFMFFQHSDIWIKVMLALITFLAKRLIEDMFSKRFLWTYYKSA